MVRTFVMIGMLAVTTTAMATPADIVPMTREVHYTNRSIVHVNARLRFTTMIILPETEEILDFVCGDKDFWIVSGAQNLAYVKPAKAGAVTNLTLVTASGGVDAFLLSEGSGDPDLTLYIAPDDTMKPGTPAKRFYTAEEVADLKRVADEAHHEAETARADAEKRIAEGVATFKASYPLALQFPYRFQANEKPFNVSAIYTDGRFTYIRANGTELPSLYEVRDGTPNLVNFQVEHGVYIVPKVLERGYLAIGKQRFPFESAR
jgi:type IV secretory pathway VirB9-like protein